MKMYSQTLSRIVIWKKQNNIYYYRIIKGHYFDYKVGYKNQYDHEIVLIIDSLEYRIRKSSKKQKIKKALINYINKM